MLTLRKEDDQNIPWIAERAILAIKKNTNKQDTIDGFISEKFPGKAVILSSANVTVNSKDKTRFPVEYLSSCHPLPPFHQLFLKVEFHKNLSI